MQYFHKFYMGKIGMMYDTIIGKIKRSDNVLTNSKEVEQLIERSILVGVNLKENARTMSYLLNKQDDVITVEDVINAITF